MVRTFQHADEDDTDLRKILKDGERWHVPMFMMDSAQHDVFRQFARVSDGSGDSGIGLHRPGFRIADVSSGAERRRIYDGYDDAVQSEWKNPLTGFGSGEFIGQRPGDICTIDGWPGHLKKINGELRCVPDRERDAAPTMDAFYAEYDRSVSEQWKGERR
jgi:hypothetical protein